MAVKEIVFRQVREDGPAAFWHVELYCDTGGTFPVPTAYVVTLGAAAQLNFILVADQWRRRGYGKALWLAVKERWPAIRPTSAMDESSAAFWKSVR